MKINSKQLELALGDEYEPVPEPKVKKLRIRTPEADVRKPDRNKIRQSKRDQSNDRK